VNATIDELKALLQQVEMEQTTARGLTGQIASLAPAAQADGGSLRQLNALRSQLDTTIRRLDSLTARVETVSRRIEQLLPEFTAAFARQGSCERLGKQLLASGYIDATQSAAIASGRYQWTPAAIRAANVRARTEVARLGDSLRSSDPRKVQPALPTAVRPVAPGAS
jgi:hypothetical protein